MEAVPDFHVVLLLYKIKVSAKVTYNNPPPIEFETGLAQFHLENGKLVIRLNVHFSSEHEARIAIEPILRAWEIDAGIRIGIGVLRFEFDKAEIVDRSPPPPGPKNYVYVGSVANTVSVGDAVSVHLGIGRYPDPPKLFQITPDVESLWHRFKGHLEGSEPLLSMAYFCLTVLETNAGGRRAASRKYNIDERVLRKLGELTSKRGDRTIARKASPGPLPPLTGSENAWIYTAIKSLILRLGDTRDLRSLPVIRMQDLPSL